MILSLQTLGSASRAWTKAALAFNKDLLSDSGISQSKQLTVTKKIVLVKKYKDQQQFSSLFGSEKWRGKQKGKMEEAQKELVLYTEDPQMGGKPQSSGHRRTPLQRKRKPYAAVYKKWKKESMKEPMLSSLEREMVYLGNRLFWMFVCRKEGKIIINKIPHCIGTYILQDYNSV